MTLLIGISGGSGSGKSTLAEALAQALPPGHALILREDWYYRDAASEPGFDPTTHDFDDVAARDHDRMLADLTALKAGRGVTAPDYCFIRHGRLPPGRPLSPAPITIIEGTHVLCDPRIAALFDLRLFVDTPADIRFIRRLLRDQAERGRTLDGVVDQYLATVRRGHERHTEPSRAVADLIIPDRTAAVRLDGRSAVQALIAPVLAHPLIAPLIGPDRRG